MIKRKLDRMTDEEAYKLLAFTATSAAQRSSSSVRAVSPV